MNCAAKTSNFRQPKGWYPFQSVRFDSRIQRCHEFVHKPNFHSQEDRLMENQTISTAKSDPIIIEQPGMRLTVEHRHGLGGNDEGLTFDVTTESEGKRILRFDCFYKNPHYHIGPPAARRGTR
jgi:hypothetical protein